MCSRAFSTEGLGHSKMPYAHKTQKQKGKTKGYLLKKLLSDLGQIPLPQVLRQVIR